MNQRRHQRAWLLIAIIAILAALVLMLLPQGHSGSADWLALLPILFVGIISPVSLLAPLTAAYQSRRADPPVLPVRFQRPPPIALA